MKLLFKENLIFILILAMRLAQQKFDLSSMQQT